MNIDYTGNVRYKKSFFGSLIVQVEYRYIYSQSAFNENDAETRTEWKDATGEDIAAIDSAIKVV